MTLISAIITRALAPMRDPDQDYFADSELIAYINECLIDLCIRERLIREQIAVVASSAALPLNADMVQIRWAKSPDAESVKWMDESTFFDYQLTYPSWDLRNPLGTIYDQKIYLHPAPADGDSWTVGYHGIPAEIAADTDTFPLVRQWEEKVVRWVRAECYYRLGEIGLGDRERARYEHGLRPAQATTDRQVPGSLNFALEPNAFDADPDSIHQGI
jgi:hypothetical protein